MRKGHRNTRAPQNKNLWDKSRWKSVPRHMSAPYLVMCCHRVNTKIVQHSHFQLGTLLSCCSPLDITRAEHLPCDFNDTQPKDADFLCSITGETQRTDKVKTGNFALRHQGFVSQRPGMGMLVWIYSVRAVTHCVC